MTQLESLVSWSLIISKTTSNEVPIVESQKNQNANIIKLT
ncbi:hypothetical protein PL8927_730034 [Planktothrix serta PCC 8927]|uniref:Uncharacterized protein n=1 Tax=Planktothrix serta PCC 8927 TaxID=671068 RepID=A0A7Z9BTU2_9CYAN|nr:hypothetical protein PL8927_730034 [Planktothrix serta PCC 8927]